MHIPPYWAKATQTVRSSADGRVYALACWQWSDESRADAQQQAAARLRQIAQKVDFGQPLEQYGYGQRALREEIVHTVRDRQDHATAVVTRNRYGALVLNAERALFIDIDFPEAPPTVGGWFNKLTGQKPPDPEVEALRRVEAWSRQNSAFGLRVYRTANGLRCLLTNAVFDADNPEAHRILSELHSDPLYVRLCQAQNCFRARLTPKPWRCAIPRPPTYYPWETVDHETQFRRWEHTYQARSAGYAVCRFIKHFGPTTPHPDLAAILTYHDQHTSVAHSKPLA